MPQNIHLEMVTTKTECPLDPSGEMGPHEIALRANAAELARNLSWLPGESRSPVFVERCRQLTKAFKPLLKKIEGRSLGTSLSDDGRWLHDNVHLLTSELQGVCEAFRAKQKMPLVRTANEAIIPRVIVLAEAYLAKTDYQFSDRGFASYIEAFQQQTVLKTKELWMLIPALKLVLLEKIVERGSQAIANPKQSYGVGVCVSSLRDVSQATWKDILEPLILHDHILRKDPAGAYARMDLESRDLYRNKIVEIAEYSDFSEMEVASEALALAREAQQRKQTDPRAALRGSHIGYYLLAEGATLLHQRVGYTPPFRERLSSFLRRYPDEVYLNSILLITLTMMSVVVLLLMDPQVSPGLTLFAMLALFLPSSQAAVQITNYLVTSLLRPQILPKLDLAEGIPDDCMTLVAVPSLLLDEEQVRRLVDDVEVRFLGNHDHNLHFALLTDIPDSRSEPREGDPLVDLCAELIEGLNEKYAGHGMGSFLMLHRHRVYNPREKVWMGWERKRGKLMDLNRLLSGEYDSFPVKAGDLSLLQRVRFVITLDADTEMPRSSAQQLIGTLAHPLNQAIIDPEKNIVVAGYGILQPRVRVSVQSASRSRLANIYSGQTGMDIYTHAVSDVYQDLYGEGIFAGKGIYEVAVGQRVLEHRFPQNALLSHDLIEGAYARVGLVTDIELIDDYPSHFSAYSRRKHRWMRGDWQIMRWLRWRVPDFYGNMIPNPISLISQVKILDNLRRSLLEPSLVLLLLGGWLWLPGRPEYWTAATIIMWCVPVLSGLFFALLRVPLNRRALPAWLSDTFRNFRESSLGAMCSLIFLLHQALISLDAIIRSL